MTPKAIYALTAAEKVTFLDNYQGRDGVFIKGFLMNDQRNKNGWRVTWESIQKYATDFINHPGTYLEVDGEPDHPDGQSYLENMSNQEWSRVTNIIDVILDEETKTLNYVAEILPSELSELDFKQMLDDGLIDYTSPGIWPEEFEVVGTTESGRPALDVFKWRALHYSYINDPAFGKDTAFTIGTCEGDGIACSRQLAAKLQGKSEVSQVQKIIKREHELLDKKVPETEVHKILEKEFAGSTTDVLERMSAVSDGLGPLQEIPLIRKKLNSLYSSCQIKKFVEELTADDSNEPVSAKLKIIAKDSPDMAKDLQLALAYASISEEGTQKLAEDLKNKKEIEIVT